MHPAFAVESHKLLMLWKYLQESVRREATQVTQGLTQFSLLLQSCPPPSSSPDVHVTSPFLPADLPPVAHLQQGDELWSRCFSSIQVSKDSRLRFHCLADLYVALLNPYRFLFSLSFLVLFFGLFFFFFSLIVQLKMVSMHSEKPICAPPICQKFPQCHRWSSSSVHLIDDGHLSPFPFSMPLLSVCATFTFNYFKLYKDSDLHFCCFVLSVFRFNIGLTSLQEVMEFC